MSTDGTKALTLSIMLIVSLGAVAVAPASAAGTVSTTDDVDRGVAASQGVGPTETDSGSEIPTSFDATVESGYFQVGSGDQNDQDKFEFTECPDGEGEECIEISGSVDAEDETFYAAPGDVNFPPIMVEDTSAGDIEAYIETPNGLEGELTQEGDMTLGGELYVDLRELSEGCGITTSFDATTGESGDRSGSAIQVSDDGETGTATLVDNEFEVPTSEGCSVLGGAVDSELDLPSPSGENEIVMDVVFEFDYAEAEQGTVTGIVTDEAGEPVSGATVSTDATNDEVRTGADGSYELALDEGDYTLEASAAGYDTTTSSLSVSGGATTMADLTLAPDGETDYRVVAEPIEGESGDQVTSSVDIVSLTGENEEVEEYTIVLDYDTDVLSFEGVSAGDWVEPDVDHSTGTVSAEVDESGFIGIGGDSQETPFTAFTVDFELIGEPGDQGTIAFDEDASGFDDGFLGIGGSDGVYADAPVSIDPIATLEGTVTDDADEPVEGATVAVGGEELTTGEDGTYSTELQPGEYDVDVGHDEYEERTQSVQLEPGETATVDVTLGTPTGVVEGVVTDADGEPVEGATVAADDQQTTTDADGAYDLELDVGDYDLEASADDFESDSATVTVEDSTTTTQDLALEAQEDSNGDGPADVAPDEFDAEGWADWLRAQADDLEDRYFERVVDEINEQAVERTDGAIDTVARHEEVNDPESARAEAEYVEDTFLDVNPDAQEAIDALNDAADFIEDAKADLNSAADELESSEDPVATAESINENEIASVNERIDEGNERLENVEGVEYVDEIDTEDDPDETNDQNDEEDEGDDDESDAMGATTQSFGVVVAMLAIVLAVFAGGRSLVDANLLKKKSI